MIVAERKKIPELVEILQGHKKILVLGCGTCVTVCLAGGEREVSIISSALRIASNRSNGVAQPASSTLAFPSSIVIMLNLIWTFRAPSRTSLYSGSSKNHAPFVLIEIG